MLMGLWAAHASEHSGPVPMHAASDCPASQYFREYLARLSCHSFRSNKLRLQLHALAYNMGSFLRTLALPEAVEHWSLTTLREKLIKIGAKVFRHGHYIAFQLPKIVVPWQLFSEIHRLIDGLRPNPAPT